MYLTISRLTWRDFLTIGTQQKRNQDHLIDHLIDHQIILVCVELIILIRENNLQLFTTCFCVPKTQKSAKLSNAKQLIGKNISNFIESKPLENLTATGTNSNSNPFQWLDWFAPYIFHSISSSYMSTPNGIYDGSYGSDTVFRTESQQEEYNEKETWERWLPFGPKDLNLDEFYKG